MVRLGLDPITSELGGMASSKIEAFAEIAEKSPITEPPITEQLGRNITHSPILGTTPLLAPTVTPWLQTK